ncbi:hypothetical protein C8D87_114155 [Lentzea atacamensis]|uniref:Uncharacterized protein n=1 Tax=Lentzea atacamensis TaxID=531938 RepID=A0ABX9DW72_9PSEU|nr:hypothetical protein [Lentzea atacamensis]RAS59543.1 hypothetical protein C8D87_114155 [Lentzea atacamensis]
MTKNMLALLDSILSSNARTIRAAVLIVVLALAPGATSAVNMVTQIRPAVPVHEVGGGQGTTP